MKDETKEIELDHFKDLKELKQNVENWLATDEMYWERWFGLYDLKTLLDYITNLQTIEQQYSAILSENAELENKITNLQNENMKYDQCLTELTDNYKDMQKELTNLQEENERLEDIRNQAITYNKVLCKIYDCGIELSNAETNLCILKDEETINILQGKSDE